MVTNTAGNDSSMHAQHTVDCRFTRQAPDSLPPGIRHFLQFFFFDMVYDDDSFVAVTRKGVLFVGGIFGLIAPLIGGWSLWRQEHTNVNLVFAAMWFILGLYLPMYIYVRYTKTCSTKFTVLFFCFTFMYMLIAPLLSVQNPLLVVAVLCLFAAAMMKVPKMWVCHLVSLPIVVICAYNDSTFQRNVFDVEPALMLGESATQDFVDRIVHRLATAMLVFGLAAYITQMIHEFERQIAQQRRSVRLVTRVAEQLVQYETKKARELIDAAQEELDDSQLAENAEGRTANHLDVEGAVTEGRDGSVRIDTTGLAGADLRLVNALAAIVHRVERQNVYVGSRRATVDDAAGADATDEAPGFTRLDAI